MDCSSYQARNSRTTSRRAFLSLCLAMAVILGCATMKPLKKESDHSERVTITPSVIPFNIALTQKNTRLLGVIKGSKFGTRFEHGIFDFYTVADAQFTLLDSNGRTLFYDQVGLHQNWVDTDTPGVVQANVESDFAWQVPDSMLKTFHGFAHFRAYNQKKQVLYDSTMPFVFDSNKVLPLRLLLGVDQDGRTFRFNMTVLRLRKVDHEYLPSSQSHDWMIIGDDGRLIWQWSYGTMYAQMLSDVLPREIGKQTAYTDDWDGNGNVLTGSVGPGHYRLVGVIPEKPVAVSDTIELNIR